VFVYIKLKAFRQLYAQIAFVFFHISYSDIISIEFTNFVNNLAVHLLNEKQVSALL